VKKLVAAVLLVAALAAPTALSSLWVGIFEHRYCTDIVQVMLRQVTVDASIADTPTAQAHTLVGWGCLAARLTPPV
jgi:hypothetical protein